jgi:hypothetical protein
MRLSLPAVLALACASLVWACGGAAPAVRAGTMPAGASFTGIWYSPQYGEMHMVQNGATVIGRYIKEEKTGRLQGTVEGDLMRFEWTQERELIVGRPTVTKGRGYFRVAFADSEQTWKLDGEWGNDQSETGGGPWTAVRSRKGSPDVDGDGRADGQASDEYESSSSSGSDSEDEVSSGGDDLSDL